MPIAAGTEDAPPAYARNYYGKWSASGLAGVWAEENTRESVFAAFQRKETFATTGPRIRVRFFAGYDLPANVDDAGLADAAYRGGVPMGGDLMLREEGSPAFLAWATADPQGTRLQRLQIIKIWVDGRQKHEQVFDVACSDDLTVDPATHRCPDNGATVELTDCSTTPDVGAVSLQAVWQDPGFRPDQHAAYYVRVLENPSCRWSTWDAVKAGCAASTGLASDNPRTCLVIAHLVRTRPVGDGLVPSRAPNGRVRIGRPQGSPPHVRSRSRL